MSDEPQGELLFSNQSREKMHSPSKMMRLVVLCLIMTSIMYLFVSNSDNIKNFTRQQLSFLSNFDTLMYYIIIGSAWVFLVLFSLATLFSIVVLLISIFGKGPLISNVYLNDDGIYYSQTRKGEIILQNTLEIEDLSKIIYWDTYFRDRFFMRYYFFNSISEPTKLYGFLSDTAIGPDLMPQIKELAERFALTIEKYPDMKQVGMKMEPRDVDTSIPVDQLYPTFD